MEDIIKVLVVDDSAYNRRTLKEMLESSSSIRVVATAVDGEDAIKKVVEFKPDVITLDLEMPRMDGFTFLRIMMSNFPCPAIVISSRDEDKFVFKALELGAIDFIAKPTHQISKELFKVKEELLSKVLSVRSLNRDVVRTKPKFIKEREAPKKVLTEESVSIKEDFPLVVIGASTGGPPALQHVLSMLKEDIEAAILIVQHMPSGFTKSFAERLDRFTHLTVKEAEEGDRVRPGRGLICPGGFHMTLKRAEGRIKINLVNGRDDKYVPSIDTLFNSAAEIFGAKTIGVVMTGMGDDGKAGIRRIKEGGGMTIAQNAATCVIFGMPEEAISTGSIDSIVSVEDIAGEIALMCNKIKGG